ncbi:MAG: nucleotidyltransferase family protein [Verrucomicrobia bacterium]|nr:nucleotidyltransferase family protein [Verrucomicrobiota bacterium]
MADRPGLKMWDWLFQFLDPLERAKVPYAVVGSVAASFYGEPRATNDVDVVIRVAPADASRLVQAFPADRFYVPPEEVMLIEFARARGGHLNVIALDSMTKADFYPLSGSEQEWFSRRRPLEISGRTVWFAAPEAVILHKLRFYRDGGGEKHLRDIRGMLAVSGDSIDLPALDEACAKAGLAAEWMRAKTET